jgi:hypothetical protein
MLADETETKKIPRVWIAQQEAQTGQAAMLLVPRSCSVHLHFSGQQR